MKILVTGAAGFLGKNLIAQLKNEGFHDILQFTKEMPLTDLASLVQQADFIYHLAGVNRPEHESEFTEGNADLTTQLMQVLVEQNKRIPVVLSSSIQATLANPYGESKKLSEEAVFNYGKQQAAPVYVYRLANLFGKWSQPNYNTVVATFCYNVSRNLPLQINDPAAELELCYIDDVVREFIQALKNGATMAGNYAIVPTTYRLTVGQLAEKIQAFHANRETLIIPSLKEQLDRDLYATYLSFLAPDNFSYRLKKNVDERGWLAEFIKSETSGQIFISKTKPGITRGNHWHHTKVEKFLVIQGTGLIQFRKIGSQTILDYPVDGEEPEVVDIPAGYTHAITNTGTTDLITLFWADELFDPENPDTYYVEV